MIIAGLQARVPALPQPRRRLVCAPAERTTARALHRRRDRLTTWHYQWLVLHEFLPLFVGQPMVDDVLRRGRRFYRPGKGEAFIPVEFQGAAYRFGHSHGPAVLPRQPRRRQRQAVLRLHLRPARSTGADPDDLRGGRRAPRRFVGWQTFFDFGDGQVKRNKRIDTQALDPALPPADRCDRVARRADRAARANAAAARHLAAAVRPGARPPRSA